MSRLSNVLLRTLCWIWSRSISSCFELQLVLTFDGLHSNDYLVDRGMVRLVLCGIPLEQSIVELKSF